MSARSEHLFPGELLSGERQGLFHFGNFAEQWLKDRNSPLVPILPQIDLSTPEVHLTVAAPHGGGKTMGLVPYLTEQASYHGVKKVFLIEPTIQSANAVYGHFYRVWQEFCPLFSAPYPLRSRDPLAIVPTAYLDMHTHNPRETLLIIDRVEESIDNNRLSLHNVKRRYSKIVCLSQTADNAFWGNKGFEILDVSGEERPKGDRELSRAMMNLLMQHSGQGTLDKVPVDPDLLRQAQERLGL